MINNKRPPPKRGPFVVRWKPSLLHRRDGGASGTSGFDDEHDAAVRLGARHVTLGAIDDEASFTKTDRAKRHARDASLRQVTRHRLGTTL
jgi:hypothetical protein